MKTDPVLFAKAIADETRLKIMIKFVPESATTEKFVKVIDK